MVRYADGMPAYYKGVYKSMVNTNRLRKVIDISCSNDTGNVSGKTHRRRRDNIVGIKERSLE